jgi:hypothetical protein
MRLKYTKSVVSCEFEFCLNMMLSDDGSWMKNIFQERLFVIKQSIRGLKIINRSPEGFPQFSKNPSASPQRSVNNIQ